MIKTHTFRMFSFLTIFVLALALISPLTKVYATTDNILLLGDPRTSQTTTYTFSTANLDSGTTIRCIDLQLDTQSDGAGSAVGTTTSFTLDSSTLITAGSWTADNSTNGLLRITNAGGATPSASGNIVYGNIVNGGTEGVRYFGIFTTYTDAGCSGGNEVDQGITGYTFKNGELVQLTIDPTLVFSCVAVTSGQAVNGVNTTVGSTASGIDHGNAVNFTTNGISAHDLSVDTNASGGYTVYIRHTGQLTNGSDNIANHTGTNAAPTAFPAPGTEAWGYTTDDDTLNTGTADRFTNPGNEWAGFTTTNEEVVTDSATDVRVGHQVGVASSTPAGIYQTTIIYTVAATF